MTPHRSSFHAPRWSGLLPLTIVATLVACSGDAPPPAPVQAVYVSEVRNAPQTEHRRFSGVIAPRVESDLSFRAGGQLQERLVAEGDRVRAGMPLARLDAKDWRLAEAAADQQVQAARADAVQSESDAARFARLLGDGSVASADAERQRARADAAAARLAQAQAELALARNRVAYTTLLAPYSGVVTRVRAEPGQVVAEGVPVFTLARGDGIDVVIDLPEQMAERIGAWRAMARLSADPEGAAQPLLLREVAGAAIPTTRTVRVRFAAPANDPRWTLGRSVEVLMERPDARDGAILPVSALVTTGGQTAVWLVNADDGSLERRAVQPVAQAAESVRVKGLPDGALVVSVGAHKLDGGLRVRPLRRDPAAVAANGVPGFTPRVTP